MTSQLQGRQRDAVAHEDGQPAAAAVAGWWARTMAQPGLLLKHLVLAVGAVYFAMIASIAKVYSWPVWADNGVVLLAALAEGFGAYLFIRALLRFRGGATGMRAVWQALIWNIVVWLGFIIGTEFFVAYTSESPFRELLIIALVMPVIMAVVPDRGPGRG
jgi:hypothetical protein